ncbi:hypothetical protein B0T24DRAFT_665473 [Lasiosphaeria ovina]|uniref:NACHT domain-containing protein n=1 Tax=Lasiosphaeria ovina TaxID=92902 RepID=A0AAE0KHC8_9PEZI|nr:hypothetical protein B0T24DRAFT_665473 [Lasiosphaeria ovina]
MADPLTIASGAVGLAGFAIKTTSSIIRLIDNLRDAPDTLAELSESLGMLKIALDRLADIDSRARNAHAESTAAPVRRKSTWQCEGELDSLNGKDRDEPPSPHYSYKAQSTEADFSRLLNKTLLKMEARVKAGDGIEITGDDESSKAFQLLWSANMANVREAWKPDVRVLANLRTFINKRSCEAFLRTLKADVRTQDGVANALPSTFGWIWEQNAYLKWAEPSKQQTLLLTGKPGTGKSVLTKTIVERLYSEHGGEKTQDPGNTAAVLSYFCSNRDRPGASGVNILQTFIFQYLWAEKSEFGRLTERCESLAPWDPFNADELKLSFNLLWDVFSSILDTTTKSHVYCIIDAMDECAHDDNANEFFRRLMTRPRKRDRAVMKLLVSGRPDWLRESGILRNYSTTNPLEIRMEPELVSGDITQIVNVSFAEFEEKLSIDKDEVVQLKQKLVSKANGMVLWAVLALREIKKKLGITLGWLRRVVDSLPSGVSEIYDRILRSLLQKYSRYGGDDDDNQKEPLLGNPTHNDDETQSDMLLIWKAMLWVARAGRALTLRELEIALSVHLGDTCFADSQPRRVANIEDFVRRISFFEIVPPPEDRPADGKADGVSNLQRWPEFPLQTITPSPTIRLIHQSAKDYILKTTVLPGGQQKDSLAHVERFGILEYAAAYWYYHIRRVARPTGGLISLVDSFAAGAENNVRFWYQINYFLLIGHTDCADKYSALHVVAAEGINSMVRFYVARGDKLDERDQYGRTPYMMAVFRDQPVTAKILEDSGANTDLRFGLDHSNLIPLPIQMASWDGDSTGVAELLKKGQLVDETDKYGRTSLFYAGQSGDWETVDVLLRAGADPLAKDNRGRYPLDVTFDARCRGFLVQNTRANMLRRKDQTGDPAAVTPISIPFTNCWEEGKRCPDDSHKMLARVNLEGLVSWLEYSPDLANAKVEDPHLLRADPAPDLADVRVEDPRLLREDPAVKRRGIIGSLLTTGLNYGHIFERDRSGFWRASRLRLSRSPRRSLKGKEESTR